MKNKFLLLFILLFLTGCSAEYNLKITNGKFKEDISFIVEKQNFNQVSNEEIEFDDQLTPFIKEKTESVINGEKFYKKKIKEDNNFTYVQMKYNFDENEFENSSSINLCFQYPKFDFSDNYYIHLQGEFYCLYSESIDIKIETNNKVYSNNADEIDGNTYIWHINDTNSDYVDIEIEVAKGITWDIIFVIIIITIVIGSIVVSGYIFYNKKKGKDMI